MADRYFVHLPDGTEYGPVDRTTLAAWHSEGRLPAAALVWPHGAPEWLSVEAALAAGPAAAVHAAAPHAAAAPATTAAGAVATPAVAEPAAVRDDSTDTQPRMHAAFPGRDTRARRPAVDPATLRKLLWAAAAIVVVLAVLGGLFAALRPLVARRWAIAAVKRYAVPERHVEDSETGLVADLPAGWLALRADNPFVSMPGARLYLAQPAIEAFGTVVVAARPRFIDALDAHLDDLVQERLPRRPATREEGRSDVQLGRARGRLVRTVWRNGPRPMVAATVAWVDGYEILTLETWAPAEAGPEFAVQVEALCRGLRATGQLETRVGQAVDRLALDVPELSPDVLRLLVAERMSRNEGLEGVPSAALLMVSRGLDALAPVEAEEMRVIYQQVWAPVPETERERMAALLREIRAGRDVPASDLQQLREALKAGLLALAPEQRARLQQLSGRAVRRALLRP
jgi:hypothetical protein